MFKFERIANGYRVIKGSADLGTIHPMREPTGRHCFRLGFDKRKNPRTYRGKKKAAEALETIRDLLKNSRKPIEVLIIEAWDARPQASAHG